MKPLSFLQLSRSHFALTGFFALVGLAVVVLGTALSPAQAQYPGSGGGYLVSVSGGTVNGKPCVPSNSPYPGSTGSTSGITSTSAAANGQAGTCKITASDGGAVTGTLTWSGGSANLPAPPAAIVMETSTATWGGTVGDSPPFTFAPDPTAGLGAGVTVVSSPSGQLIDPQGFGFGSSTSYAGIKYSAAASGSSATTTCSPTFVLSGTTGVNANSYEYAALRYTYTANAYPVTLKLDGSTPDNTGKLNILVGQRCTAGLVGIPQELLGGTTYSWSVSGKPLQSWTASSSSAGPVAGLSSTTAPTTY